MSLGSFVGLGHELYVGFDKPTVRLLIGLLGAPFLITLAGAACVLSHKDVGWSLQRLECWLSANTDVNDEAYLQQRGPTVWALRLACAVPPVLSVALGCAMFFFLGADYGLAGLTIFPALAVGGWAAARARHVRWRLTPRVRLAGGGALAALLLGEIGVAVAPST
jgi:hypothetical protein